MSSEHGGHGGGGGAQFFPDMEFTEKGQESLRVVMSLMFFGIFDILLGAVGIPDQGSHGGGGHH